MIKVIALNVDATGKYQLKYQKLQVVNVIAMTVDDYQLVKTHPCKLCRDQSIPIGGRMKYCVTCYKELVANAILGRKLKQQLQ